MRQTNTHTEEQKQSMEINSEMMLMYELADTDFKAICIIILTVLQEVEESMFIMDKQLEKSHQRKKL